MKHDDEITKVARYSFAPLVPRGPAPIVSRLIADIVGEAVQVAPKRCECGCLISRHEDGDGACSYCVDCHEFCEVVVCSHCGEAHDPDDSAAIAEELAS